MSNRREERREVGRGTRSVRSVRHSFHSSLTVRTSRVPILRLRLRNVVEGDVRRMERTRVNIPFSFRLITHYALFLGSFRSSFASSSSRPNRTEPFGRGR